LAFVPLAGTVGTQAGTVLATALPAGPTVATTRDADRALDQLRVRSRPLRLLRRSSAEAGWARTLLDSARRCTPRCSTRTPAAGPGWRATVRAVRAGLSRADRHGMLSEWGDDWTSST
jgi:hypothetical protein